VNKFTDLFLNGISGAAHILRSIEYLFSGKYSSRQIVFGGLRKLLFRCIDCESCCKKIAQKSRGMPDVMRWKKVVDGLRAERGEKLCACANQILFSN
jgi:hypothetical protein